MSLHEMNNTKGVNKKPLTVLVTRTADQLTGFAERALREQARIIAFPLNRIVPLIDSYTADLIRTELARSSWIFLTSANAARIFFSHLRKIGVHPTKGTSIAAIGKKTAEAVVACGYEVSLIPQEEVAEGLLEEFLALHVIRDKQLLIPAAVDVRPVLETGLFEAGYQVKKLDIYRIEPTALAELPDISGEKVDYYCFLSSSSVDRYHELFGKPAGIAVSIGKITTGTMKEHGWEQIVELPSADLDSFWELIDA